MIFLLKKRKELCVLKVRLKQVLQRADLHLNSTSPEMELMTENRSEPEPIKRTFGSLRQLKKTSSLLDGYATTGKGLWNYSGPFLIRQRML